MSQASKHSILISLAVSLFAILLLAASLDGLQLQAGVPFPGSASDQALEWHAAPSKAASTSISLLQGMLALVFVGFAIYVPLRLITHIDLRKLLVPLLILAGLFLILLLLPQIKADPAVSLPPGSAENHSTATTEYATSPLGEPPQAFIWIVFIALGAGFAFLIISFLRQSHRAAQRVDPLQQEAAQAADSLRLGQNFTDVIIRSYLHMITILQEERGLERESQMTASEFERLLEARGVPHGPVHQLTLLFEKVRYGGQAASDDDQRLGLECLDQIVKFCAHQAG